MLIGITSHCQSNPSLSSYSIWLGSTITHCRTAQYIYVSIFKWFQSPRFGYFGFRFWRVRARFASVDLVWLFLDRGRFRRESLLSPARAITIFVIVLPAFAASRRTSNNKKIGCKKLEIRLSKQKCSGFESCVLLCPIIGLRSNHSNTTFTCVSQQIH